MGKKPFNLGNIGNPNDRRFDERAQKYGFKNEPALCSEAPEHR